MVNRTEQTRRNWSGSVRCTPALIACPQNEADLSYLVRQAGIQHRHVRPAGAGHSSSPLVATDDMIVSVEAMQGIEKVYADTGQAMIRAGTTLVKAGEMLFDHGLAFHNLGDIDKQTVVGAFMTGTHGSGRKLRNLSSALVGGRLVTANGSVQDFSLDQDPDLVAALRVSLGVLGILTALRVQLEPAHRLRRREWCADTDDCLLHLDELVQQNHTFDFYWYPRRDDVKIRTLNPEPAGIDDLSYARCIEDRTGWSHQVIAQQRDLKFEEMEYALPAAAGPTCFREIRDRIKRKHRQTVGWRILYRTVAPDDA